MTHYLPFFLFLTGIVCCNAQILEKGTVSIDPGVGFGIYGASSNDNKNPAEGGINAACGLVYLDLNYSLLNSLGIGAGVERNGYLGGDSANAESYVRSWNIPLSFDTRVVNSDKNTLSLKIFAGPSLIRFGNPDNDQFVHGSGFDFGLGIHFRHYFNEHIGFFLNGMYARYSYRKFYDENENLLKVNNGNDALELSLFGANLRTGLCLLF
ncbi:MAG: outer membrane beta-barrel protein [Bacteroidota bacterium]